MTQCLVKASPHCAMQYFPNTALHWFSCDAAGWGMQQVVWGWWCGWFLLRMNVQVIWEVLEVKMLPIMSKFVCLFVCLLGLDLCNEDQFICHLLLLSPFIQMHYQLSTYIYIIQATIYTWTKIRFILLHTFHKLLSILPKRHHWRFHKSQKEPKGHFWMNYV